MIQACDSDGHAIEWEGTFSDDYLDPAFAIRRPRVVRSNTALHWLVDSTLYPSLFGQHTNFVGSPCSIGDERFDGVLKKPESLACLELRGPGDRLELMDVEGLALSVIYPTLFLIRPLSHETALENALCNAYNRWIADVCTTSGGRLRWVAVVNLDDPVGAVGELERVKAAGAVGVMLPGLCGTDSVVGSRYAPVWEAAAGLDLAVSIHVAFSSPLHDKAFVYSVLMGFEQILASGLLDRYPALRVGFIEAGCQWVPFLLERLEERTNLVRTLSRMNPDRPMGTSIDNLALSGYRSELEPKEYLQRGNVFVGFEPEDELLPLLIDKVGDGCFLFGTDIPHADRLGHAAAAVQKRSDLDASNLQHLLVDNTLRFYGLDPSS